MSLHFKMQNDIKWPYPALILLVDSGKYSSMAVWSALLIRPNSLRRFYRHAAFSPPRTGCPMDPRCFYSSKQIPVTIFGHDFKRELIYS